MRKSSFQIHSFDKHGESVEVVIEELSLLLLHLFKAQCFNSQKRIHIEGEYQEELQPEVFVFSDTAKLVEAVTLLPAQLRAFWEQECHLADSQYLLGINYSA